MDPNAPTNSGVGTFLQQLTGGGNAPTAIAANPTSNTDVNDVANLASQQAQQMQGYNSNLASALGGAYSYYAGQNSVDKDSAAMNKIQDTLNSSSNAQAAVPTQTVAAARGSFANNDQVNTQEATSQIPYAEQVAQLGNALVPAENAYQSAVTSTNNEVSAAEQAAQLEEQGLSTADANELAALQAAVTKNTAIQTANIGANAQTTAAQIAAQAGKYSAALSNPGIKVSFDANGNPNGLSYLNTSQTSQTNTTPNGTNLDTLKQQIASQFAAGPSSWAGKDQGSIAQIAAQGGLSIPDATNLYYSIRAPYEKLFQPQQNLQSTVAQNAARLGQNKNGTTNPLKIGNALAGLGTIL